MFQELLAHGLKLILERFNQALEQGKKRNYDVMSTQDKMTALRADLQDSVLDGYFWIVDLFASEIIIETSYRDNKENYRYKLMSVPYEINNGVASFGSPIEVERITSYKAVSDGDGQDQNQGQVEVVSYQPLNQSQPLSILLNSDIQIITLNQEDLDQAKKGDYSNGLRFTNAVLTTFDVENSQNQVYPGRVWESNLPQLQEKAKNKMLIGESDHPLQGRPSVDRNALMINEIWIKDNQVLGNGKILPTEKGKNLIAQAVEGIPIAVSSRGYGTVQFQEYQGKRRAVIQDDYVCVTFDAVWAPSAPGSYITGTEQNRQEQQEPETTGQQTVELNQSNDIGEQTTMNPFQKKLAELRGMLQYAKLAGKNVESVEQELNAIEQAYAGMESGMTEAQVSAIMGPIFRTLNPSGERPDDNDKGGVNDPTRTATQSADGGTTTATQTQTVVQENNKKELSEVQKKAREAAVQAIMAEYSDPGVQVILQGMLEEFETANDIFQGVAGIKEQLHKVLGLGSQTYTYSTGFQTAGIGLTNKEAVIEKAPKNASEAIQHLSDGIPDLTDSRGRRIISQDNQKLQFERYVHNISVCCPHIMQAYIEAEMGRLNLIKMQSDLGVAADIAVTYAALLPMIRQAWSALFLPVIASIQTLDKPEGKIFYLKALTDAEDELNKYHYYDYSDGVGEYEEARRVKFKITSDSVECSTKKLKTTLSYEEIQDARAYHNLDAFSEAIGIAAMELAREWNNLALRDLMLASGTSGDLTFGMQPPQDGGGDLIYTRAEWESQGLKTYLNKGSSEIFKNRQGGMTDILVGPTAALQIEKLGSKFGFMPQQGDGPTSVYAGVNIFGSINKMWNVYVVQAYDEAYALNKALLLRKGTTFSDTAYVFAPYTADVTPANHGIDGDFSVTQGIMSRAARKVVSPKNIATLEFADEEGVLI